MWADNSLRRYRAVVLALPARAGYTDAFTVMRADSMGRMGRRASSKSSMAQPANYSILKLPFIAATGDLSQCREVHLPDQSVA
jgi:hypothetical protein